MRSVVFTLDAAVIFNCRQDKKTQAQESYLVSFRPWVPEDLSTQLVTYRKTAASDTVHRMNRSREKLKLHSLLQPA
jgi:hypothetical protein